MSGHSGRYSGPLALPIWREVANDHGRVGQTNVAKGLSSFGEDRGSHAELAGYVDRKSGQAI